MLRSAFDAEVSLIEKKLATDKQPPRHGLCEYCNKAPSVCKSNATDRVTCAADGCLNFGGQSCFVNEGHGDYFSFLRLKGGYVCKRKRVTTSIELGLGPFVDIAPSMKCMS